MQDTRAGMSLQVKANVSVPFLTITALFNHTLSLCVSFMSNDNDYCISCATMITILTNMQRMPIHNIHAILRCCMKHMMTVHLFGIQTENTIYIIIGIIIIMRNAHA